MLPLLPQSKSQYSEHGSTRLTQIILSCAVQPVATFGQWPTASCHCLLLSRLLQAQMKGISALVMLSEGTLLSGGERDRKIIAWDTLQNYKKITETKVGGVRRSLLPCGVGHGS